MWCQPLLAHILHCKRAWLLCLQWQHPPINPNELRQGTNWFGANDWTKKWQNTPFVSKLIHQETHKESSAWTHKCSRLTRDFYASWRCQRRTLGWVDGPNECDQESSSTYHMSYILNIRYALTARSNLEGAFQPTPNHTCQHFSVQSIRKNTIEQHWG